MKCLILGAGYATRLYPLTENFPKPLLMVGGKAILDWLMEDIGQLEGLEETIVVSNHRYYAHFLAWAAGKSFPITVLDDGSSTNETRLGAVRDIAFAVDRLHLTQDLLVVAGDNLLDFSLAGFVAYAQEKKTSCIMRYFEEDLGRLKKCGVMEVDEEDRVHAMVEKPKEPRTHWCCPPFYYYRAEDVCLLDEGLKAGCGTDAPGSYAAWLSGRTCVHAMRMPGRRYDIGDLASYRQVQSHYRGIEDKDRAASTRGCIK